jgi:hypothetical protein
MRPTIHSIRALALAGLVAAASSLAPVSTYANSTQGAWSSVQTGWPALATHVVLLPSGKVLFWRAGSNTTPYTWDPATQAFATLSQPGYNIFCSGHILMADGKVFVGGGHIPGNTGLPHASIYNPANNSWTQLPDMNAGRWYPSSTLLPNGDILIAAGLREDGTQNNEMQVWQTGSGAWRNLTGALKNLPLYPEQFLVSNGRVFFAKQSSEYLDPAGAGSWSGTVATRKQAGRESAGSACMYRWGQILWAGGRDPATNNCEVIDANASTPVWNWTGSMAYNRRQHNLTVLPDGKVLATGGTSNGDDPAGAVFAAEMWDPDTGNWTVMASTTVYRGYHSTALLLPDGRVLSAGGNVNRSSEIYSPPYLFKGARPTITAAPDTFSLGATIFVQTPNATSIATVSLLRLGAVTHSTNTEQRYDTLAFTQTSGGLNVTIPADGSRIPGGHYMLFIVNGNGVPSVAKIMSATPGTVPAAPGGLTATAVSSSQINLNWTDNSNNETQFRIERRTGAGSFGFLVNKGANTTTHSDAGLQPGTTYTYRVRAENAYGNSAWSNEASATPSGGGLNISNLSVASGKAYVVVPSLANGELVYIDRTFTWSNVGTYSGLTFIRTANDDKNRTETAFLSFNVSQTVTVYVAYDIRATSLPNWLSSWTNTGDILGTTDVDRRIYAKQFSAGTVTLGGNAATGMAGANSMYSVIIAVSGGAFQESGGEVVMEGENFHALDGRTDPNGVNWQTATAITGAVGGQYLETPGPQGTNGEWSNACEASYHVNFTTTGTYNVWVRRYAVNGADNSVFAGLNGAATTGVDNTTDYNAWVWKKLATVSVSSAGVHTFQLRRREAGYKVDRIVLRTSSATPSGNGPAESPQ